MQNNKVKSATVAGLLGIFLGQFGAHSWYLGKKKQGIAHVCLFAAGMILIVIAAAMIVSASRSLYSYYRMAISGASGVTVALMIFAWLILIGNGIWALVEAIIILSQGDAGLAAKGYAVAAAYPATPNSAAQSANPAGAPAAPASATPGTMAANAPGAPATAPSSVDPANPASVAASATTPAGAAAPVASAPVAPKPKQPMNPATKKKIILGCAIGAAALVAIIIICIVIAIVSHVDYSETYRQAKVLKEDVSTLSGAYDCQRVVSSVDSDWTDVSSYNKYIEACRKSTDGIDDKIAELEKTQGIRKNSELSAAFAKFKEEYSSAFPAADELNTKLELYKTWHSYIVAVDDLEASDPDSQFQAAANILINSNNDTFKTYGTNWLEKTMDYVRAYRAYQNSSYSDSNRSTLREDMYSKQSAQRTWVSENKPNIKELAPLDFSNMATMYSAYRDFYNLLTETYEEHYNKGSGDCSELLDVVYCS